jgi:hypothetical protein
MDNETINRLRQKYPQAVVLIESLTEEYQRALRIAIPVEGGMPYFAVEMDGGIRVPAEPHAHSVCAELSRMLHEAEPENCAEAMRFAAQIAKHGPRAFGYSWQEVPTPDTDSNLIDGEAYEVVPEERRLS